MGKVRSAASRVPLPSLFDQPKTVPPLQPEVAVELIPLLERLLLAAKLQTTTQTAESRRDAHER